MGEVIVSSPPRVSSRGRESTRRRERAKCHFLIEQKYPFKTRARAMRFFVVDSSEPSESLFLQTLYGAI